MYVLNIHQIWFRGIVTDRGSRYEIDKKTPKIMAGSKSLHTTAVYNDLLGDTVAICKVGYNPLIYSFHTLVDMDVNSERDHKTAIAVILLLEKMEEDLVGESGRCLINDWGDICRDFFEKNGNEKTITLTHSTSDPVKKVAIGVRILCQTMWQEWKLSFLGKSGKYAVVNPNF
ncbi:hypothetical protein BS78_08G115100 [Paspalum vaginatum]|nr:hypothetical protein BS78_08G115100 [Paspalum vaginatum]